MSIAALTQIRLSHDFTLPPRNEVRFRNAEKNASWTQSDAWSRSGTIRDDQGEELVLVERRRGR